MNECNHKQVLVDGKLKDHQGYILRLKKTIQELQKDRNIGARLEVLEKKLSDEELSQFISATTE